MLSERKIYNIATTLRVKFNGNPFDAAESMHIHLNKQNNLTSVYAFFSKILNKKYIFYNPDTDEHLLRFIIAHEVGHCLLHSDIDNDVFEQSTLNKISIYAEREANLFAAHFCIPDNNYFHEIMCGNRDVKTLSQIFRVPPEAIVMKEQSLTALQINGFTKKRDVSVISENPKISFLAAR